MAVNNNISSAETIHEVILDSCKNRPEHLALSGFGGKGNKYSYKKLEKTVKGVAAALRSKGLTNGRRIGILSTNSPEWGIAYVGILAAGNVVVPLDAALKETELIRFFRISGIDIIFCGEKFIKHAKDIITLNGYKIEVVGLDGEGADNLEGFIGEDYYLVENKNPDDTAVIIYTSGTTGEPKGVVLTHKNVVSNLKSIDPILKLKKDEVFLSVLPMHHTFEATAGFLFPLSIGLTIVYARALNTRDIKEDISNNKVTYLVAVPLLFEKFYNAMKRGIAAAPAVRRILFRLLYTASRFGWGPGKNPGRSLFRSLREKAGMGSLRTFISGGAPLPPIVAEWFNYLGFEFLEGYGLTECSPVVSVNRPGDVRFGSVGPPLPGVEVAIDNPSSDGIGELKVKGNNNTPGYLDDPDATAELIRDGWLFTGDLGRIDDGYLYITGRKKNLIVSGGGKNIYPEELENELNLSGYILESIIFGRKKENKTGEEIRAIIVPDLDYIKNSGLAEPTAEQLRQIIGREVKIVNNRLADYKRIEKFEIQTEEFEKTSTRKIKRRLYI
jgi:long-chain acyl-CoA synthetase